MSKVLLMQRMHEEGMQLLENAGHEVVIPPNTSEEALLEIVEGYDAIIVRGMVSLPGTVIEKAKNCRVIGRHGVGLETIDVKKATQLNIPVVFTPGANANAVAEQAVSLMLDIVKQNCYLSNRLMRQKDYQCRLNVMNYELRGRVLGLIGLGNIGRRVAQICVNGFGMKAVGYDPYMTQEILEKNNAPVTLLESINDVLKQADVVSLHAPGSENAIISFNELDLMKPGSVLINTARGNLVDEDALYTALINNKIYGAGLDVTGKEPPDPNNPLFELENVVATPHTAALTEEGSRNMAVGAASQVIDVLLGKKPWGLANPEIWEQRKQ